MSSRKTDSEQQDPGNEASQFESMAREGRTGLFQDFWDFLRYNKKWWLLPIVITILLMGLFVLLSGTPAGSFIYTLF